MLRPYGVRRQKLCREIQISITIYKSFAVEETAKDVTDHAVQFQSLYASCLFDHVDSSQYMLRSQRVISAYHLYGVSIPLIFNAFNLPRQRRAL